MDRKPVVLEVASNERELRNWKNILITKNEDHIINFEIAPACHLTKDSRSARTRISNQHQLVMN